MRRAEVYVQIFAKTLQPSKLVFKFVAAHGRAVGDIGVDDGNTVDLARNEASVGREELVHKALAVVGGIGTR